jgi:hypothetical protein
MTGSARWAALAASLGVAACGPGNISEECIPIDDQVAPGFNNWCGAWIIHDPNLEWDGPPPAQNQFVCLAPDEDGECDLCGVDQLEAAVEWELREQLAILTPACELEHWEVHCMHSIENGMSLRGPDQYCCYEIAVWGENCEYSTTPVPLTHNPQRLGVVDAQ